MAAGGADEAVGPALGCEMPSAGGFIGKARLEGGAGHRAIVLPAAGHHRTLSEHSADGNRKPNMSSNRGQRDKPFTKLLSPARRRPCVDYLQAELGISERRACAVVSQHRSTQRKMPRGRDDEEALTAAIIGLASQYGRYGYRRITALLRAEGW